jgi:hypothetical protein
MVPDEALIGLEQPYKSCRDDSGATHLKVENRTVRFLKQGIGGMSGAKTASPIDFRFLLARREMTGQDAAHGK